jgi:NAD(P)-dependent dehydrogenase (short-subunit alcohol dehydrogenase family)
MSRVALVTGASRGIGEVVAARLASDGFSVAVAARGRGELARVAKASGSFPVVVDVTDATAVGAAVEAVESELGHVDLLVNNAGVGGEGGATWEKDPAAWWRVFEVNVLGAFLFARAVLPSMCSRGTGRVVNVASNAAFFRLDDGWDARIDSAYQASKAALVRLTEALAAEARPRGVTVIAISPGTVKTSMTEGVFADLWDDPELWTPPERAAELVAFIASGALDGLSGRYIHASSDRWETMAERTEAILADDLNALRLRTQGG